VNRWIRPGGTGRHAQIGGPTPPGGRARARPYHPAWGPAGRFPQAPVCEVSHD